MEYREELLSINKTKYEVSRVGKCKKLGGYSFYQWLVLSVVLVAAYIFFTLVSFMYYRDMGLKGLNAFLPALVGGALFTGIAGVFILPMIIVSAVGSVKLARLISKGRLTAGLITKRVPVGKTYKNGQQFEFEYIFLNDRNVLEVRTVKARAACKNALKFGRKVLVAYTEGSSAILSDFELANPTEATGAENAENVLTGKTIPQRLYQADIIGDFAKAVKDAKMLAVFGLVLFAITVPLTSIAPVENNSVVLRLTMIFVMSAISLGLAIPGIIALVKDKRRKVKEAAFIEKALVTEAEVITAHFYREKDEGFLFYRFTDHKGASRIGKRLLGLDFTPPDRVRAAYNPENPDENLPVYATGHYKY